MRLMTLPVAAAIAFIAVSAGAHAAEDGRAIVVFASERIRGQWVKSHFDSIADGGSQKNECEAALGEELKGAGFRIGGAQFGDSQRRDARKFRAVFGRYGDISAMPNDVAVRAAAIVDPGADAVVACGVSTGARKWRRVSIPLNCADANCKAVDARTGRRIAALAGRGCLGEDGLPAAGDSTASVAAIREACRDVGGRLARKMAERH